MNSTVNLAYCSDENDLDLLALNLKLLKDNIEPYIVLNLYIYTNVEYEKLYDKIKLSINDNIHLNYRYIDDKIYSNYFISGEYTNTIYYRFEILKEECKRMLYLDTDVFVKNGLLELFNTKIYDECCICGVKDYGFCLNGPYSPVLNENYINSCVMLIDIEKIKNEYTNLMQFVSQSKFPNHDQDAINVYFKNRIQNVDVKFNTLTSCIFNETTLAGKYCGNFFNGNPCNPKTNEIYQVVYDTFGIVPPNYLLPYCIYDNT